jgi:glutamyl-tRNA reductase
MDIILFGTSYKFTPIKDIEPVYIGKDCVSDFLSSQTWVSIQEIVILSTCNRFECYIVSDDRDAAKVELFEAISTYKNISFMQTEQLLSPFLDTDPINHLFNVSSGIESMVFGENEILTQVKESYQRSLQVASSGPILNKVFQSAVAAGKRVRSETQISKGAYSVSSIAIEAIRERLLDYFACNVLIVGAGTMGIRAMKKLHALGHPSITLTNRTQEKADKLADSHDIQVLSFENALKTLNKFEIIIMATGSKCPIITTELIEENGAPRLIVDLGVPRNVEIDSAEIQVITVGGLKDIADKNIKKRKESLDRVVTLINNDISKLYQWYDYKLKCQNVSD